MKDFLDVLPKINTLPMPTLCVVVVCILGYFLHFIFKNYFGETVFLEKQKRKLEVAKLELEVAELRKRLPGGEIQGPTIAELQPVPETWRRGKKFVAPKPNIKWFRGLWLGGASGAAFPLAIILYTLLHLPSGTSRDTLETVCSVHILKGHGAK